MTFMCPKCGRYGMEWDGRGKVLVCYYSTCNHIIALDNQKTVPTALEIQRAIEEDQKHAKESRIVRVQT
jgi:hypothetical protein